MDNHIALIRVILNGPIGSEWEFEFFGCVHFELNSNMLPILPPAIFHSTFQIIILFISEKTELKNSFGNANM